MKYYNYKRMSCGQGGAGADAVRGRGGKGLWFPGGADGTEWDGMERHQPSIRQFKSQLSLALSLSLSCCVAVSVSVCASVFSPLGHSHSHCPTPVAAPLVLLLLQLQHVGTLCLYGLSCRQKDNLDDCDKP